jgi:UDP-N-acetylmuramoyl-L-alanyl-D-glutamate--2,6-diaminopimelate ligase
MPLTRLKSPDAAARWLGEWVRGSLRTDSREVKPGDAFVAWPGYATDGRRFVAQSLAAGAATCLVEDAGIDAFGFDDARVATLPGLKAATGPIADAWFGRPSERLDVIATTGTNGKTSTAWWTAQALSMLGRRCGVVGTLGIGEPPRATPAPGGEPPRAAPTSGGEPPRAGDRGNIQFTGLTTPDPVRLHGAFRDFADAGFAACALEASSIGLVEHRLTATRIDVALFTNFTRDHLDFHGDMAAYWAAKRALFSWPGLRAASINIDDPQGAALAAELAAAPPLDVWTVSATSPARLRASGLRYVDGGLAFDLHEGAESIAVHSRLVGDYNASNVLVVIGGLRALGVSLADAAATVPGLTPVPGRLQRVAAAAAGQPEVVVDYAHTPDALEKVLMALRPLAAARGGRLHCVFGCGGNRDASKRPLMGAIAHRLADAVVLTSDNPRDEAPGLILSQILAGVGGDHEVAVIEDRHEAIAGTIADAAAEDVILLAGKGHETYQEVAGVRRPFSDEAEALAALRQRAGETAR